MRNAVVRRSVPSLGLAVVASVVLAGNVLAAPSWTAPMDLRTRTGLFLGDADFADMNVAVVWQEPHSGGPRIGMRASENSGATFVAAKYLPDGIEPAVEECPGSPPNVDVAYTRRVAPGEWRISHVRTGTDLGGLESELVADGSSNQRDPDIACASGRVFVSYYEADVGGDRMFIAHAPITGEGFSSPFDLGLNNNTEFFGSLAVAGVNDMAYVVFARSDGDLRFKRFGVSTGPGHHVTAYPAQVIANGAPNDQAAYAVIAAEGMKVAVIWFRCSGIYGRVSNDQGANWGPVRTLMNDFDSCESDASAAQNSVAIRDGRIAIAYGIASAFGGGEIRLIRSNDDLATFSDVEIVHNFQVEHLVGFVTVGGQRKLAAAFQNGSTVRYRGQL